MTKDCKCGHHESDHVAVPIEEIDNDYFDPPTPDNPHIHCTGYLCHCNKYEPEP